MVGLYPFDFLKLDYIYELYGWARNSYTYYEFRGPYANPSPSAGPAQKLGHDIVCLSHIIPFCSHPCSELFPISVIVKIFPHLLYFPFNLYFKS